MTIHIEIASNGSGEATWTGDDPDPVSSDSSIYTHTILVHRGDISGEWIGGYQPSDNLGFSMYLGVLPEAGTYTIEVTQNEALLYLSTFIWDGTSALAFDLAYQGPQQPDDPDDPDDPPVDPPDEPDDPPVDPPPAPDPANDLPFSTPPTFRSAPVDVEVGLDVDQRMRFDSAIGAFYPNPDGQYFFVQLADADPDGIYEVDGTAYGQPGYLLRITANNESVISSANLPLGGLLVISAGSPRPGAVTDLIAQYQNQLGITLTRFAYGVMGRVGGTFTARRIGTADPEPVDPPVDPPVVTPEPIPYLRHATRHVHATVLNIVREQLTTLGWTQESTLPFGPKYANVVRFIDSPAIAGDRLADGIEPGIVACTVGPEQPPDSEEIGGPLSRQDYPIFFDVFQGSYSATTALANDIRDILLGRFPGTRRHIGVIDQTNNTRVPGWTCELTDVTLVRPEIRLPLHWQVVKVTAEVYFPEVQW